MAGFADWDTLLYFGKQAAEDTEIATAYCMPTLNEFDLGPINPEEVAPEMVRDGTCHLKKDYVQAGKILPTATGIQAPASSSTLEALLASLMSTGTNETGSPQKKTMVPWTSDTPSFYYTFMKYMEAQANSPTFTDAIVSRVAINFPFNGAGTATFDLIAKTEAVGTQAPSVSALNDNVLLTKDATITWDGDSYNQLEFSLEIQNTIIPDHQKLQNPAKLKNGTFRMTGTLTLDYDEALDNGIAADVRTGYDSSNEWELVCTFGSAGSSGYFYFTCACNVNGRVTQTAVDGQQRLVVPWRCISGTLTPSFECTAAVGPFVP